MRLIDADVLFKYLPLKVCVPCPFGEEKECEDCVVDKVMQMIEDAPTVEAAPRWVRCEDGMPVKGEIVIVSDGKHTWDVGQYHCLVSDDRTKWWWKGHTIKTVKWWMRKKDALPDPPREDE